MKIGNTEFQIGKRTYIVGILNVTPDSFSDGGYNNTPEAALLHAEKMAAAGADIIEIGGESTRPGSMPVSDKEEKARILPVIRLLKQHLTLPLSVDTMKCTVAEAAILEGADMINDVSCLRRSPKLAGICAHYDIPLCIMHSRESMMETSYSSLITDVMAELSAGIRLAKEAGLKDSRIIIDPGVGFSKTQEQNLKIIDQLNDFASLHYPIMLGVSRKRFIGSILGDLPTSERLEGTLAITALGIARGCDFVRVHDVKENKRAAVITDAIVRRSEK